MKSTKTGFVAYLYVFICASFILFLVSISNISKVQAAPTDAQQANSVGMDGTVRKDPPSQAPTITTPKSGQSLSSTPVTVAGLCNGDLLIKIFSNGVFVGSAQCSNGSYSLSIDLFSGTNDIVARGYDALDQSSPDSATVRVTFTQNGFNTNGPRVSLSSEYAKRGANPNDVLEWPLSINGGTGPYAVSVNWGDGTTDLVSRAQSGAFTVKHIYTSAGTYAVVLKVTDANGNSAFLQLVGVANGAVQSNNGTPANIVIKNVVLWWPLALAAVLIVIAFWLGRKDQLTTLRRQADKRIRY